MASLRGSDDKSRTESIGKSDADDDGEVRSAVQVLHKTAKSAESYQVFEGRVQIVLHIEKAYSDNTFNTFIVEGLSVDETQEILTAHANGKDERDVLVDVMGRHENDSDYGQNIAEGWRWGYGIYDIRHFGGHLLVEVGKSCD